MNSNLWHIVKTTAAKRDSLELIADSLVSEQLCGCVQIHGPIQSHFHWNGKLEVSEEFVLEGKTSAALTDFVCRRIRERHPYDVPEIIVIKIEIASPEYEHWLAGQLRSPTDLGES